VARRRGADVGGARGHGRGRVGAVLLLVGRARSVPAIAALHAGAGLAPAHGRPVIRGFLSIVVLGLAFGYLSVALYRLLTGS
jgi:hypothetical protein